MILEWMEIEYFVGGGKQMNVKKRSRKQEEQIAKDLGGKPTIASGALYFQKADVRSDIFLCEAKFTDKDKYVLTLQTWEKIRKEALRDRMRIPLMMIELPEVSLAVLNIDDFYGLIPCTLTFDLASFRGSKTRVALDSSLIDIPINSRKSVPYSLISFEEVQLVVMDWEDFLMMQE